MDVGEDERPLGAPSVDLHVIIGTQEHDGLERIDYGVAVDAGEEKNT